MIIKNKFCNWNHSFQKKLKYASFGPINGLMCGCVSKDSNTLTYVYMNNIHIKGWLIVGNTKLGPTIMTFTNKRYRKSGVSSKLVVRAISDNKINNALVFPHDVKSENLYKKIQQTYPNLRLMSGDEFYFYSLRNRFDPPNVDQQWSAL